MADPVTSVGVVGLGHMGKALAQNIIDDGYDVKVFGRHVEPTREHFGRRAVPTLAGLRACDAVFTCLPDDDALLGVAIGADGLTSVLQPGSVHIATGTISPTAARRVAQAHRDSGQSYVAAPVLGNPSFARDRKLFLLVAGEHAAVQRISPLLDRLGQRLFVIGEDPGLANLVKLAANALTASTLQCLGEVLALMEKGGIDGDLAFHALTESMFDGRVHKAYGSKIVTKDFSPPGMAAPLALKDVRLALAEAERLLVPMPATSLVHDRLVAMISHGWADLDWSALGQFELRDAGLGG